MPLETFTNKDIDCVNDFQVAHLRDGEGYSDNWYDMEDDQNLNNWMNPYGTQTDETKSTFKIRVP